MSTSTVNSSQRFTVSHPCPICGGHHRLPQGHGSRCYGFLSGDGRYAHCTREEYAGRILQDGAGTYAHILEGLCNCGKTHGESQREAPPRRSVRRASHTLKDASGTPLFVHKRQYFDDGTKEMWWEQVNGTRGLGGVKMVDLPPYGIHEFEPGPYAIVTEGEPAQEAVTSLGFSALGTVCGASSCPGDAALQPLLTVPTVYLWVDNDADGVSHMTKVGKRLIELGHQDVRWLEWPEAPKKGDAADLVAVGGTADDVRRLMDAAKPYGPGNQSEDDADEGEWLFSKPWPNRQPIPEPTPVPNLPADMVPEPLRPWLSDCADIASLPIEMIAAPALVAIGAVIGRTVAIRPWEYSNWVTVANPWGMVAARPGWMKTHAVDEALSPIGRLAATARERFEEEKDAGEAKVAAIDAQLSAIKAKMNEAAKNGGVLADLQERYAEKLKEKRLAIPTERRYLTHDATVEKLGELLKQNPRGMLVVRDELYGLLRSFEKSGHENDRQFYLEAWSGTGSHTSDRIGRGTIHIPNLTLSVIGGIQPGRLRALVEETASGGGGDDGLMQRFQIFIWPDSIGPWKRRTRFPDNAAKNRAFEIFKRLDGFKPFDVGATSGEHDRIPYLTLSPLAQRIANDWQEALEGRLRSGELDNYPAFASHLGKYRSLMPELALLFHLVDKAAGIDSLDKISEWPVKLAIMWCDYLEHHARKLYDVELDRGKSAARALATKIGTGAIVHGQSVREIYRHQWSGLRTDEVVLDGLIELERLGWVRLTSQITGGRPGQIVELHPDLQNGGAA